MIAATESPKTLTPVEMTHIIEEVHQLSNAEHEQIFKIIQEQSCRYTENLNGVFLNLTHLPVGTLHKIQEILIFWRDQKAHIDYSERQRQDINGNAFDTEQTTESVCHRADTQQPSSSSKKNASRQTIFNEKKHMTKLLTKEESNIVCGITNKRSKLTLNNHVKQHLLKTGGSALRVAKKCLASNDDK